MWVMFVGAGPRACSYGHALTRIRRPQGVALQTTTAPPRARVPGRWHDMWAMFVGAVCEPLLQHALTSWQGNPGVAPTSYADGAAAGAGARQVSSNGR